MRKTNYTIVITPGQREVKSNLFLMYVVVTAIVVTVVSDCGELCAFSLTNTPKRCRSYWLTEEIKVMRHKKQLFP